jgi:hypothetical protein
VKILNQLFIQHSIRNHFYLEQKKIRPTNMGALFFLLFMEMSSSTAFAQVTPATPIGQRSATVEPSETISIYTHKLLLAEAGTANLSSDTFNPGLQLPPAKTEDLNTKPQTRSDSAPLPPPANLANPPLSNTTPVRQIVEVSSDSDNFNPGLVLPPPKTELPAPPPKAPQLKPVNPSPEQVLSGQVQGKPNPVVIQSDIQTPGRSRPGGSRQQVEQAKPAANSPPVKPEQAKPASNAAKPILAKGAILILESLVPNVQNTRNESGQINQTAETTASFLLENGDRIKLVTGYNTFIKPGFATVNNVPINLSWETNIDSVKIEPSIGVNLFDRLTSSPTYGLRVAIPIASGLTLSGAVESGAYKFNTETIQNQISAVRYGPGISWQIDQDTSFLAIYKFGNYSDGNTENQLFSRLERKSGQFWVAANLFSWGYGKNIGSASGYFSPPDFLAYSGEIGVEGNVFFDSLTCRLSAQLGNQQASGATTIGQAFQGLCKTKLSPSLEANFGYGFGNSRKDFSSQETGNTNTITGGVTYKF